MSNVKTKEEKREAEKVEYTNLPFKISEKLAQVAKLNGSEKEIETKAMKTLVARFSELYQQFKLRTQITNTPGIYVGMDGGRTEYNIKVENEKVSFVGTIIGTEGRESHIIVTANPDGKVEVSGKVVSEILRPSDIVQVASALRGGLPPEISIEVKQSPEFSKQDFGESLKDLYKF